MFKVLIDLAASPPLFKLSIWKDPFWQQAMLTPS